MTAETIPLAELLELIGYSTDTPQGGAECMSLCQQAEGTAFSSAVGAWSDTPAKAANLAQRAGLNLWFGVNPLRSVAAGRGKADDVVRLAALIADLDLKEGGCPDLETALAIVTTVSETIGADPVAVTHSGHGLQPYWAVEPESGRALLAQSPAAKQLRKRTRCWRKSLPITAAAWTASSTSRGYSGCRAPPTTRTRRTPCR